MTRQDIIRLSNDDFPLGDLYVNGVLQDTRYGDSDMQHIYDLILYAPGSLKEYPTIGFNVRKYQSAEVSQTGIIEQALSATMSKDGYRVSKGCVQPQKVGGFIIDTTYISPNY